MKYDLIIYRGADVHEAIKLRNFYPGYSIRMQARLHPGDDEILFEVTPTIDDRYVVIEIAASETMNFDWVNAVYDMEFTSPEGKISVPVFGNIRVRQRVTR